MNIFVLFSFASLLCPFPGGLTVVMTHFLLVYCFLAVPGALFFANYNLQIQGWAWLLLLPTMAGRLSLPTMNPTEAAPEVAEKVAEEEEEEEEDRRKGNQRDVSQLERVGAIDQWRINRSDWTDSWKCGGLIRIRHYYSAGRWGSRLYQLCVG